MKKNNATAPLLPESHTGQRFIARFGKHLRFIEAENPYVSQATGKRKKGFAKKPETNWRTEKNYRLRPRTMWRRFNDPKEVIGVNFGTYTDRVVIDIDSGTNPYHPEQDEGAFKNLLGALELIGLCRPIFLRSSWSDGQHIYFFLPKKVKTFDLACAVESILREASIKPKSGQVELFPNTKGYNNFYKSHRLPLQPETGATILNQDYQPYSDNLDLFLDMADATAEYQDMELLEAACEKYRKVVQFRRCVKGKGSLKKFERDLLAEFLEGFTASGQTNNLLLTIACYGVVFMGLDEEIGIEPLADYIEQTITSLDGYAEHCNHQHDIRKRCLEVAKSSQAFYWAAGKPRKRQRNFVDNFGKFLANVENLNEAKAANTKQRLEIILAGMQEDDEPIPTTQKGFIAFINAKSKAVFETGFSPITLRKPSYKSLWLPVFDLLLATQVAVAQPTEATTPIIEPAAITVSQQLEPRAIAPIPDSNNIELESTTEQQQKSLDGQLQLEAIKLVLAVLETDIKTALDKPTKNAETRIEQQGYTPCSLVSESKTLKPLQNNEGTHPALYGGFGKHPAKLSKTFNSPSLLGSISSVAEVDHSIFQGSSSRSHSAQQIPKTQTSSQIISPANQSMGRLARPRLKIQHKQDLSVEHQQREQEYLAQMQELHRVQNALEAQQATPEYQTKAQASFDAIRGILGTARAKFKRGDPSPPT